MKTISILFLVASVCVLAINRCEARSIESDENVGVNVDKVPEAPGTDVTPTNPMKTFFNELIQSKVITGMVPDIDTKDYPELRDDAIDVLDDFLNNPDQRQRELKEKSPAIVGAARFSLDIFMQEKERDEQASEQAQ